MGSSEPTGCSIGSSPSVGILASIRGIGWGFDISIVYVFTPDSSPRLSITTSDIE